MSDPVKVDGGYDCPNGHGRLKPRPGSMYFRGRWFAGLVCYDCPSLWDNPDDSMIKYATEIGSMEAA